MSTKDNALWARLNALKIKSQATKANISDLQARFAALKGEDGKSSWDSAEIAVENKAKSLLDEPEEKEDLETLLEEMGSAGNEWLVESLDEVHGESITQEEEKVENKGLNGLLSEADRLLKEAKAQEGIKREEDEENDVPDGHSEAGESDAAAEYLEKLLAELSIIERHRQENNGPGKGEREDEYEVDNALKPTEVNTDVSQLDLPATPQGTRDKAVSKPETNMSHLDLPSTPPKTCAQGGSEPQAADDDSLEARLAALMKDKKSPHLPSTSATTVGEEPDDSDNWCIICYDNATIQCFGCDGDLYCNKCWKEGHTGPDAGFEERRHKAAAYKKDAKKQKKQSRRALAA